MVGGGFDHHRPLSSGQPHPQFRHHNRVSEEAKRNINRSSSGMMVAQNSIQNVTSMVAGMANKLEQKRRERRMQGDRRGDM